MSETQKLIAEIDRFLAEVPMAETTFGRLAVNDGKLLARLRSSGTVTLDKADQIRRFMRERREVGPTRQCARQAVA